MSEASKDMSEASKDMSEASKDMSEADKKKGKAGKTACVILIGDELLSGRTQDSNLMQIAGAFTPLGIDITRAHVIPDDEEVIIATVNAARKEYDYVVTTGGIGPTHDDITARSIARAFGRKMERNKTAAARMEVAAKKRGIELNESRLRMADMPEGVELVANRLSGAPGFWIENVIVLAGIPAIAKIMLEDLVPRLESGTPLQSLTLDIKAAEGDIAEALSDAQARYADLRIGSYPYYTEDGPGVEIVLRAREPARLRAAAADLQKSLPSATLKTPQKTLS